MVCGQVLAISQQTGEELCLPFIVDVQGNKLM